jgi:gephyrin
MRSALTFAFAFAPQDGYAVVAGDGPGDYEIVGDARCGDAPTYTVKPGTVAYITTGGTHKG